MKLTLRAQNDVQLQIALFMPLTESEGIEGKLQTDVIVQLYIKS
jgi:hypothetical protein